MKVQINSIKVKDGRRSVDYDKVKEIANSIKEIGLINPITLDTNMILIAGQHRLEAVKLNGQSEIEANIIDVDKLHAELAEIDENLIRNELHYIDRGNQLQRRKEIYEELYPETKAGGDRKSNPNNSDLIDKPKAFTEDIAKKLNVSRDTIENEIKIAKNILPEVQEVIKEKDIKKTDALKIAKLEPEQQIKIAEKISIDNAKSFVDARRLVKKDEVHETPRVEGKYRIIYADPPWCYGDKLTQGYGTADNHYPTMTIEELCELPIKEIAEDNAVLLMWVTSPLLEECFAVIKAWGFKYKSSFIWDKVKHNMGHYNSVRHELLLVCTRGSCLPDNNKLYDSVVSIERSNNHSEKPEEFRNIIDDLYREGKRIELFARKKNEGWDTWGNEA
jgi:N6-adenosine-specific RNA methylase IME4/ParB-like chromosome segregation protein Spo0J